MNIKYSKKKEELRKDPVLEFIEKAQVFVTKHSNIIISGFAAILLLFAGFHIYSRVIKSKKLKAQEDFGRATLLYASNETAKAIDGFTRVIENHKNSSHAAYSAYIIGHMYLAQEKYDGAIYWFEKVASHRKKIGFIRGESLEALATCYEAKGDYKQALQYFDKAIHNKQLVYRYPAIRWKMALLNKKIGDMDKVEYYCNELISDTLALKYKMDAENLLAVLHL